jgi:hypothetical protein
VRLMRRRPLLSATDPEEGRGPRCDPGPHAKAAASQRHARQEAAGVFGQHDPTRKSGRSSRRLPAPILALILIGSGESNPSPDWTKSFIVSVKKRDPRPTAKRMSARLLIDVGIAGGEPIESTVEARDRLRELTLLRPYLNADGVVLWHDCISNDQFFCESALYIVHPLDNASQWRVRLRVADTQDGFTDHYAARIILGIGFVDSNNSTEVPLAIGQDVTFCLNLQSKLIAISCSP